MKKSILILIAAGLVFILVFQNIYFQNRHQKSADEFAIVLSDSMSRLEQRFGARLDTIWGHILLSAYQLPDTVYVCGVRVPLERGLVREKVEYELFKFLRQRNNLVMWYRLQGRYFPMIESSLVEKNLPVDFKYLTILESLLNPKAESKVKAGGLWQFMPETGRLYHLDQNKVFDQRFDPWLSTRAARKLIIDLYRLSQSYKEQGDLWLALAQYVCAPNTIRQAVKNQKNNDYFTLALPRDAQRYVPQFIALCVIYHNPKSFGLDVFPQYPPLPQVTDTVISLPNGGTLTDLAKAAAISMDDFMLINTQFLVPKLPPGKYKIKRLANQPFSAN